MNNMDNIKEFVGNIKNEVISFNDKYKEIDNKINENIKNKTELTKEVDEVKSKLTDLEYNYVVSTETINNRLEEIDRIIKETNEQIDSNVKEESPVADMASNSLQSYLDNLYEEQDELMVQKNKLTRDFDKESRNLHVELDKAIATSNNEELINEQQTLELEKMDLLKNHYNAINEIENKVNEQIEECDKALEKLNTLSANTEGPYLEDIKAMLSKKIAETENNKRILNEVIKENLLGNYKNAFESISSENGLSNNGDTAVFNNIVDILSDIDEKLDDTIVEKLENVSNKIYASENVITITNNNGKIEYRYKNAKTPVIFSFGSYDSLINQIKATDKDFDSKRFTIINEVDNVKKVCEYNNLDRTVNLLIPIISDKKEEVVEEKVEEKVEEPVVETPEVSEVVTKQTLSDEELEKKITDFVNELDAAATNFDYYDTYNLIKNNINDEDLRSICIDEVKARINELEDFMLDETVSLDDIDAECERFINDFSDVPELADAMVKFQDIRNRIKETLANTEAINEVADNDETTLDSQQSVETPVEEPVVDEPVIESIDEPVEETTVEPAVEESVPEIEDLDATPEVSEITEPINTNEYKTAVVSSGTLNPSDIEVVQDKITTDEDLEKLDTMVENFKPYETIDDKAAKVKEGLKVIKARAVNFKEILQGSLEYTKETLKLPKMAGVAGCSYIAAAALIPAVSALPFAIGATAAYTISKPIIGAYHKIDEINTKNELEMETSERIKKETEEFENINNITNIDKKIAKVMKNANSYVKASIVADRIQSVCDNVNALIINNEDKYNLDRGDRISFYVNPTDKLDESGNIVEPKSAGFVKIDSQTGEKVKLEGVELTKFKDKYHGVFNINEMLYKEFDAKIRDIKGKERNGFRARNKFNANFYDEVVNKWDTEGVQFVKAENLLSAFRLCDGLIEKEIVNEPVQIEETVTPVVENVNPVTESIEEEPMNEVASVEAVSEVPEIQDIPVIQPINNNQDDFDVELNSSNDDYDLQDIMNDLDNAQNVESIAGLDEITEEEINDEELENIAAKKLIKENKENK